MKKILFFLLLLYGSAFAQKIPDNGFDKVRITEPDKTIQAYLKPVSSDPEMETGRFYYWYSGNGIHATQGGYSGRLLNGPYSEYYINKNLKEQGTYQKGLKQGVWKSWNEGGFLRALYTWNKGIKSGKFSGYDEKGNLKQSGSYRDNLLDGTVKNYADGKATPIRYRRGVAIADRTPFWQRLPFFKKKNRPAKAAKSHS